MKTIIAIISTYALVAFVPDSNATYRIQIEDKVIYGMPGDTLGIAKIANYRATWVSDNPNKIAIWFQYCDGSGNPIGSGNRYPNWPGGDMDSLSISQVAIPALNVIPK